MPTFEYEALSGGGRLMTGTLEAMSTTEAGEQLREMGLHVRALKQTRAARPAGAISRGEFLLFNQQLAGIAEAGIPLERSLRELADDVTSARMRRLILEVADDLESGKTIEEAFERRKRNFPPLYGRILAAGIKTGRLSEMLNSLNRHLETARQTRRIVFEASCYPAVVLALCLAVATFMFAMIVPQFEVLLESLQAMPTQLAAGVFAVSRNLQWIWFGIGAFLAAAVALKIGLAQSAAGRRATQRAAMNLPVLGRIYRNSLLARLADAMAALVSSGVDMPTCLRLGASATGSEVLRCECEAMARRVESGQRLYAAGADCKVIPRLFLYSMEWGSDRGELADNLYGLSEMHAEQARTNQARLRAVMMPVLLLVVGAVVGLTAACLFWVFKGLMGGIQAI